MLPKHVKKETEHKQVHIRQTHLLHTAHPACDKLEVAINCLQSMAACFKRACLENYSWRGPLVSEMLTHDPGNTHQALSNTGWRIRRNHVQALLELYCEKIHKKHN